MLASLARTTELSQWTFPCTNNLQALNWPSLAHTRLAMESWTQPGDRCMSTASETISRVRKRKPE